MAGRHNHYKDKTFQRGSLSRGAIVKILKESFGEHAVEAAKKSLAEGAEIVVKDAKARCPVYEGHKKKNGKVYYAKGVKPGALKDSIQANPNRDKTVYYISADAKDEKGFLYGQIVEFSPRVNKPFLYPAMAENKLTIKNNIKDAIRAAVRSGK